jgi:hypothetical protein
MKLPSELPKARHTSIILKKQKENVCEYLVLKKSLLLSSDLNQVPSAFKHQTLQIGYLLLTTWMFVNSVSLYTLKLGKASCRPCQPSDYKIQYVPTHIWIDFMSKTQKVMWEVASFLILKITGLCATVWWAKSAVIKQSSQKIAVLHTNYMPFPKPIKFSIEN